MQRTSAKSSHRMLQAGDDNSSRSDTSPDEAEEGPKMPGRRLPDNVKSRYRGLKVFIKNRKPVAHAELTRRDVLGQIIHSRHVHAVTGGADDMIR